VVLIFQCGACVAAIEGQMKKLPGIKTVQISLLAERGVVEYDGEFVNQYGEKWTEKKIADEIEDIGFDAEVVEKSEIVEVELRVYGYVTHDTIRRVQG
jgi:Cu+-exporting ATPase